MKTEKLNKKLAEWAGIEPAIQDIRLTPCVLPSGEVLKGTTRRKYIYPNFTQSLDACFKWLVPKLEEDSTFIVIEFMPPQTNESTWIVSLGYSRMAYEEISGEAEISALALCLAIEKLIDMEAIND